MKSGEPLEQELARYQPENGVSQELQLFVILHRELASDGLGFLMRVRAVRQRALQQFRLAEPVSQCCFQGCQVGIHGDYWGGLAPVLFDERGARPASPARRSCSISASFCNSGFELANCSACSTELSAAEYCLRWSCASARWYQRY